MSGPADEELSTGGLDIALLPFAVDAPPMASALRVYGRVWPDDDPDETRDYFAQYAGYEGFVGLVAVHGGHVVGAGFGAHSYAGIWWHDEVARRLGAGHPALQHAWRLVELAVEPEFQGRGIGGRLHDALLRAHAYPRGLIATTASNRQARAMYERRGWEPVCEPLLLPGKAEAHVILGREFARS